MTLIHTLFDAGDLEGATQELHRLLAENPETPEVLAHLAEDLGDSNAAMRAWQLVLRRSPDSKEAWLALANLHEERGDNPRAEACRKRVGVEAPPAVEQPQEETEIPQASNADLLRFLHLFSGREDTHARMWKEGERIGWSPVPGTLTPNYCGLT